MPKLIGSVKVMPPQVAPGESVQVQVLDPTGTPYTTNSNVIIALDGVPVPSRYYQFPTTGTRTIAVYATGNNMTETATATVNVAGESMAYHRTLLPDGQPSGPGQIPFILLGQDLTQPYLATFSLGTPPPAAAAAARARTTGSTANAGLPSPAATPAQQAPAGFLALQALFPPTTPNAVNVSVQRLQKPVTLPAPATSYIWTFGDGQTATTDTPFIAHDYFPAIVPGRVPHAFDVQCRIVHDNITVTRTLVLYSLYGMCQRNNVTVPNVNGDVYATLNSDRTAFSASLLVCNIEAAPMTVSQMAITPVWDDAAASFPAFSFKQMEQPVTVAPKSSSLLAVQVLRNDLSTAASGAAVTGFIVAFQGTLAPPLKLPGVETALRNQLAPGRIAFSAAVPNTVVFSRHVRLHLQDQQLPQPAQATPLSGQAVLDTLGQAAAITATLVRSGSLAVDPATNVVSVGLTSPAPSAAQAGQLRRSVLSVLSAANVPGGQ